MPTPVKSTRERADDFLRDAVQFRLGALVTEVSDDSRHLAGTSPVGGAPPILALAHGAA